jgi:menaquinone-dependent protoporphyrinogen oxidase
MAGQILIVYSTVDGHTLHICERMAQVMQDLGAQVTLSSIEQTHDLKLDDYDRIVIGASIRYGHHRPNVGYFINHHRELLLSRPNAFFSVNVVARKPDKNTPQTNPYARKFLQRIGWKPQLAAVFAGKIDYPRYGRFDRMMIRLIMWITHGPTDPSAVVEFTDWAKVESFAYGVCALPTPQNPPY